MELQVLVWGLVWTLQSLDGLYLSADLLGGQAVQGPVACYHHQRQQHSQPKQNRLKLPEPLLLHHCRATAGGKEGALHYTTLY